MDIVYKPSGEDLSPVEDALTLVKSSTRTTKSRNTITSTEECLEILESQPSLEDLDQCLGFLVNRDMVRDRIDVRIPSPQATRIVSAMVNRVAPDFWKLLEQDSYSKQRQLFLETLRSIPGLGALLLRLRSLSEHRRSIPKSTTPAFDKNQHYVLITETRSMMDQILTGEKLIALVLDTVFSPYQVAGSRTDLLWKQAIGLFAGGRILSTLAGVDQAIKDTESSPAGNSLGAGEVYATWLGANIRHAKGRTELTKDVTAAIATLFGKALSLGYTNYLVREVFRASLSGDAVGIHADLEFLDTLKNHERRQVLYAILAIASEPKYRDRRKNFAPGLSALLHEWCKSRNELSLALSEWLTGMFRGKLNTEVSVRYSVIIVLSDPLEVLIKICDDMMQQFGDKLYIQNAPVIQQDILTQNILIVIGRLHQRDRSAIAQLSRSSIYINAISSRIASSSTRPRFLGMTLAVAVSELVDKPESRVKFKDLADTIDDTKPYMALLSLEDAIGTLSDLAEVRPSKRSILEAENDSSQDEANVTSRIAPDNMIKEDPSGGHRPKALIESESGSGSESETEDDPTLANRKKPTPPVYIRELLAGLRDEENYERYRLYLSCAANLVRRKANFGTEVTDHAEELASVLAGSKDSSNTKNFTEFQLQGMIAVIVAQPDKMGQWFSISAFTGDYSISQRVAILTALTLAGRELAGYKQDDVYTLKTQKVAGDLFPSQRLPTGLEAFAGGEDMQTSPVDTIASNLERTMIQPMAASAADEITGPNMLKVRTFSSRVTNSKQRKRIIHNDLARVIASSFFFPLTDRFRLELDIKGSASAYTTPFLLSHYLKTLALLISASGPNTLSLPALTTDFLGLCLTTRIRGLALQHVPVLDSLVFSLLTILDVNSAAERDLVVDHGKEILEIKAWVEDVLERLPTGDTEHEHVRVLAAGVLVRCAAIIEAYQQEMMAGITGFL